MQWPQQFVVGESSILVLHIPVVYSTLYVVPHPIRHLNPLPPSPPSSFSLLSRKPTTNSISHLSLSLTPPSPLHSPPASFHCADDLLTAAQIPKSKKRTDNNLNLVSLAWFLIKKKHKRFRNFFESACFVPEFAKSLLLSGIGEKGKGELGLVQSDLTRARR